MSERTAQEHADTALADAIAWLERSRDSKSPSLAQVHARALLADVERLTAERDEARAALASAKPLSQYVLERAEAAEALAERRGEALRQIENGGWRAKADKYGYDVCQFARAALAEDASHQDAGEPGYGGVCGKEQTA